MVLKNPAAQGAQGFEKPQIRGGNGFEKLGEMGCLASENRHGPMNKRGSSSYFSNQCPRTFAPKLRAPAHAERGFRLKLNADSGGS
jgi:hypothetical protein